MNLAARTPRFIFRWTAWSPRFQCVTYNARGYPPSDVPPSPDFYSQDIAASDIGAVLDAAGVDDAHLLGVSMGSAAVLQFALRHPARARSIVLCSIGSGSDQPQGEYRASMEAQADFAQSSGCRRWPNACCRCRHDIGSRTRARPSTGNSSTSLRALSPLGIANTMRGVQARRPPIYAHKDRVAALKVPTLIVVGDEDEPCVKPSRFLHETIPGARLEVIPKCGHLVNIEEPAILNPHGARIYRDVRGRARHSAFVLIAMQIKRGSRPGRVFLSHSVPVRVAAIR